MSDDYLQGIMAKAKAKPSDLCQLVAVCEKAERSPLPVTIDPVAVLPVVRAAAAELSRMTEEMTEALTEQRRRLCAEHDKDIAELKRVRTVAKEMIDVATARAEAAESTIKLLEDNASIQAKLLADTAHQARQAEETERRHVQTLNDNGIASHSEAVAIIHDLRIRLRNLSPEENQV